MSLPNLASEPQQLIAQEQLQLAVRAELRRFWDETLKDALQAKTEQPKEYRRSRQGRPSVASAMSYMSAVPQDQKETACRTRPFMRRSMLRDASGSLRRPSGPSPPRPETPRSPKRPLVNLLVVPSTCKSPRHSVKSGHSVKSDGQFNSEERPRIMDAARSSIRNLRGVQMGAALRSGGFRVDGAEAHKKLETSDDEQFTRHPTPKPSTEPPSVVDALPPEPDFGDLSLGASRISKLSMRGSRGGRQQTGFGVWIDGSDRIAKSEHSLDEARRESCVGQLVDSLWWQHLIQGFCMLSCAGTGVEVQYCVQSGHQVFWPVLCLESLCCLVFVGDVVASIWLRHSCCGELHRAVVSLLTLLSVADVALGFSVLLSAELAPALPLLRLARLLRLVRLSRNAAVKVLLRGVVGAFQRSCCTFAVLLCLIYVLAVVYVQLAGRASGAALYFGSLWHAVLWLFAAITGGVDWMETVRVLWNLGSPAESVILTLLFVSFIFCATICLLNLAAGVFMEAALSGLQVAREIAMRNSVRELFTSLAHDSDEITFEEFFDHLSDPRVVRLLDALDIDISETQRLFELLDHDRSGCISLSDFVSGCVRLHGQAKAIDLAALMYAQQHFQHEFQMHRMHVEDRLSEIIAARPQSPSLK